MLTNQEIALIKQEIARIKETMATKDDIALLRQETKADLANNKYEILK